MVFVRVELDAVTKVFQVHYSHCGFEAIRTLRGDDEIRDEVTNISRLDGRVKNRLTDFILSAKINESLQINPFTGFETWSRVQ